MKSYSSGNDNADSKKGSEGNGDENGSGSDSEGGGGSKGGSGGGGDKPKPPEEVIPKGSTKLDFALGKVDHDAASFTFGALTLTPKLKDALPIKVSRFMSFSKPKDVTAEQQSAIAKLCKDLELSSSPTELAKVETVGSTPFHVFWRSHYPESLKKSLSDLVVAGQDISCILKVDAPTGENIVPFYLSFDPVPKAAGEVTGSAKAADAISRGLMLPLTKTLVKPDESPWISVDGAPEVLIAVAPLTKEGVKLTAEANAANCVLDPNKAGALLNPTAAVTSKVNLETTFSIKVGAITPAPIEGRLLKSCEALKPVEAQKKIETALTCGTYQAIKNEGLEAGCQWDIELANEKDPLNTITARVALDKVKYTTFDIKKVDQALANIPKSQKNPVVTKAITFRGFNDKQLKSMEQTFDLWLAVEPKSYDEDVHNYMKTITRGSCDSGVLGFAGLRSATFTICDYAAMSDSALNKADDPFRPIIQLITTSHEVRHAVKWYHDKDDRSYPPCGGTASSSVTMHAVATCQLDYCFVLKNMALRELRSEINYSLANDQRKFQGQCKAWTDELGVKL